MEYRKMIEAYLGKSLGVYQEITSGWDFDVWLVDDLVFRFPKTEEKRKNMLTEKKVLDMIRPYITLKIPEYTLVDDAYIVYPIVEGIPMSDFSEAYTTPILEQLVGFIKELHSVPLSGITELYEPDQSSDEDQLALHTFVKELKEEISQKLSQKISERDKEGILSYIDDLFLQYTPKTKVLVHSDIQGKNIIYNPTTAVIEGIIDFTDMRIGSPELDFCHLYSLGEDILWKSIERYTGYRDKEFFDRVIFLAKREAIFEIQHESNFGHIMDQLKKYGFVHGI